MAGDWIKLDSDLEDKPKYHRLLDLTGVEVDTLTARIVRLWWWVDQHVNEGFALGVTPRSLAMRLGGDVEFWQCFEDPAVQWLDFQAEGLHIPRWEVNFGTSARRRLLSARRQQRHREPKDSPIGDSTGGGTPSAGDHRGERDKSVTGALRNVYLESESERDSDSDSELKGDVPSDLEQENQANGQCAQRLSAEPERSPAARVGSSTKSTEAVERASVERVRLECVEEVAAELFRHAKYGGSDGGLFWKGAALLAAGVPDVTLAGLIDAARGCDQVDGVRNKPAYFRQCMRRLVPDFDEHCRRVHVVPCWPKKPPEKLRDAELPTFEVRSLPKAEKGSQAASRAELLAQIEALA